MSEGGVVAVVNNFGEEVDHSQLEEVVPWVLFDEADNVLEDDRSTKGLIEDFFLQFDEIEDELDSSESLLAEGNELNVSD